MAFFECEFSRFIGFQSSGGGTTPSGGPGWSTIVNMGFSGLEQRNRNWSLVRNKYQLDLVARPLAVYQTMLEFWLAVGGRADAFRFFDATDSSFTNMPLFPSVGDGSNTVFQLQKVYTVGAGAAARSYTRTISKPIQSQLQTGGAPLTDFQGNPLPNTLTLRLDGGRVNLAADYSVDATTGLVTFSTPPGAGVKPTADGQFHVPVRFDSDDWPAQILESNVLNGAPQISVTGIQLVEVKILPGQSQG